MVTNILTAQTHTNTFDFLFARLYLDACFLLARIAMLGLGHSAQCSESRNWKAAQTEGKCPSSSQKRHVRKSMIDSMAFPSTIDRASHHACFHSDELKRGSSSDHFVISERCCVARVPGTCGAWLGSWGWRPEAEAGGSRRMCFGSGLNSFLGKR